ncbi:EAL domain-containing protein [Pseudomonas zhanjiangensis]|uniref:EAL domain-containing protein n=1 Tax=Pseudomonas zhanjiangensis TaxID=3239015 RepID=A0ABV3YXD8_9PSED
MLYPLLALMAAAEPREVRVGVFDNAPQLLLDQNGQVSGIFGDILFNVAARENWRLQAVQCVWAECLGLLRSGQIDLLPDVPFNETRAQFLDFQQQPSLYSWSQFYSDPQLQLDSVLDLKNTRIAVLAGSLQYDYLAGLVAGFSLQAQLLAVPTLDQAFQLVSEGAAEVAVANQHFGDYHAPDYGLRENPIVIQPTRLYFSTGKGRNGELLQTLDHYLLSWRASSNSPYQQILQRWAGEQPRPFIPSSLWWSLALLALLLLASAGGALLLRRQVSEKTHRLQASETRLNTILDSVEAYIYIKDPQLRYQYANRKLCERFGRPLEQVIGCTDEAFFDARTANQLRADDHRVLHHGERVESEDTNLSLDGGAEHTYLSVKLPLRRPDGDIYALCGIATDISEHKRNLEQIHRLAFYDQLTGLANRRLLLDRLQHALDRAERNQAEGALLFIDLDNFKDLNDSLGHDRGDQLLQQVAQRLSQQARKEDTLARLGGDEFVLVLEELPAQTPLAIEQIEAVAGKLLEALAEPYSLQGETYTSSVSIGVSLFFESASSTDEVLKRADMAMYEAKAAGRNGLRFFNPAMQAQVNARAALDRDLRLGMQLHQFILYYQPQVNHLGKLIGAEALVRWQHPERGLVQPGQFIALAESTGLILPLGRCILLYACRQLVRWAQSAESSGLHLAVNVSARQFHHPDFVAEVLAVLDETGANPQRLELELTESLLIEDVEAMIEKMSELRSHGVHFSLDDFGTGYSSLSQLKRLPLDQLKIDRCFVRDLLSDRHDAAIVRTIVALGDSLELSVIAEGVETPEQRDALLSLGCRAFQGYHFGAPGPAEQLHRTALPATGR